MKKKLGYIFAALCTVLGTVYSKYFVIACTVLIGLQGVTNGQTYGRTPRR